jgi:hypothetical protein
MSKQSPERLARTIAVSQITDCVQSMDWMEDDQFAPLVEALLAELPEHKRKDVLDLRGVCELQDAIRDQLPTEEARSMFFRLLEWYGLDTQAHLEAGYLIGVEMGLGLQGGLRLRGGAR